MSAASDFEARLAAALQNKCMELGFIGRAVTSQLIHDLGQELTRAARDVEAEFGGPLAPEDEVDIVVTHDGMDGLTVTVTDKTPR